MPGEGLGPAVGALVGAHLGAGDAEDAGHGSGFSEIGFAVLPRDEAAVAGLGQYGGAVPDQVPRSQVAATRACMARP